MVGACCCVLGVRYGNSSHFLLHFCEPKTTSYSLNKQIRENNIPRCEHLKKDVSRSDADILRKGPEQMSWVLSNMEICYFFMLTLSLLWVYSHVQNWDSGSNEPTSSPRGQAIAVTPEPDKAWTEARSDAEEWECLSRHSNTVAV